MKKKLIKTSLSSLVIAMGLWGIVVGYNKVTDGFGLHEIKSSLPFDPSREIATLDPSRREEIKQMLAQPFRYLGKGCQFFAFQSDDGRYVLKFFKHKHLRPLTWLSDIPMPAPLRLYCDQQIERREERIRNIFSSCKLAYEELPEETGLLFLHLNRTPALESDVVIIDKLGLKHTIALDEYEFILQKKAVQVGPSLLSLVKQQSDDKIRAKIRQLAKLVAIRCEKGVRDRDRSFVQNIAFCDGEERAVFVDFGQFYKDASVKAPEETHKDVLRRLNSFKAWAEEKYPQLVPFAQEEIACYMQSTVEKASSS